MFKTPIKRLSENLHALRDFIEVLSRFLVKESEEFKERHFVDLLPILCTSVDEKENEKFEKAFSDYESRYGDRPTYEVHRDNPEKVAVSITFPEKGLPAFRSALKSVQLSESRKELLYKSSLISLTSSIEWFLCELLKIYFQKFHESLGGSDKVFSLNDLQTFETIHDARNALIDSRVENILRGSFEDWIKFFKNTLHLSMGYLDRHIDDISEVFQRRNIIVHNGSKVNSIYMGRVPARLRANVSIGREIAIDEEYLEQSINLFESSFILIGAEFWKQLEPQNENRASNLLAICFQHLMAERWCVSESLSCFIKNDKKTSERSQLLGQMNFWQSLKWQGRYDEFKEQAEELDFSAKDELFQLALFALTDRHTEFFKLLPKILNAGKLSREDLEAWPIFRQVRNDPSYAQFKESPIKSSIDQATTIEPLGSGSGPPSISTQA